MNRLRHHRYRHVLDKHGVHVPALTKLVRLAESSAMAEAHPRAGRRHDDLFVVNMVNMVNMQRRCVMRYNWNAVLNDDRTAMLKDSSRVARHNDVDGKAGRDRKALKRLMTDDKRGKETLNTRWRRREGSPSPLPALGNPARMTQS